jgi:hypothetical protein
MKTLLSNEILEPKLTAEILELTATNKKILPDILVLNYLTNTSFFSNKRFNITIGNSEPINPNIYSLIVGSSGSGKSRTNKIFYESAFSIQKNLFIEHKKIQDFVTACSNAAFNKFDPVDGEEDKIKFVKAYNLKNGSDFTEFMEKTPKEHIFLPSDFTPEKLAKTFNHSANNTLFLNSDEFDNIQQNFRRTSTTEQNHELTQYYDGRNSTIIRLGQNTECVEGAFLTLLGHTTPAKFEALKNTDFFSSGNGYRFLFIIHKSGELLDYTPPAKRSEGATVSTYEVFQEKIRTIFQDYFFNQIYNTDKAPVNFSINTDKTLNYFAECVNKLKRDYIDEDEVISEETKGVIFDRIPVHLAKLILNVKLMNYSFAEFQNWQPFENIALTVEDIKRGYLAYDYFLSNMIQIFSGSGKPDLAKKQMQVIEVLPIGGEMEKDALKKVAIDKKQIMSLSSFYTLLSKKSNCFALNTDYKTGKVTIKRLM